MTNDAVTDEDHVNMGLPIYKKTRTRIPKSDDVPEPEGKATAIDGRVSLGWRGRKSGSKANPYGQKVVVKYTVFPLDDPAPTHIANSYTRYWTAGSLANLPARKKTGERCCISPLLTRTTGAKWATGARSCPSSSRVERFKGIYSI
jgi:hypothetical protein